MIEFFNPVDAPAPGAFSRATRAGGLVFVSGTGAGNDVGGQPPAGSATEQTRLAIRNVDEEVRLRARLAEAQAEAQNAGDESEQALARSEAADRDYRAFLDRVRKESLEQASLMTVEPVTLPEVQVLLPDGTTLLEYLVCDHDVRWWTGGPRRW